MVSPRVRSEKSWKALAEHSSRSSTSERTSFRNQFCPWLLSTCNGRNNQWSDRCSRLPGRHSLQWCNSGSTFTESAQTTRKASWQRTTMPNWEMHPRPTTSGLLGARAVQRRIMPSTRCQRRMTCPRYLRFSVPCNTTPRFCHPILLQWRNRSTVLPGKVIGGHGGQKRKQLFAGWRNSYLQPIFSLILIHPFH